MSKLRSFVLATLLALPAAAHAYHASDMIIGSTVAGGGALSIRYDFANLVEVSLSFAGPTQSLYSGTDPGWDAVFPSEPPLFALAAGTAVRVQITAIDAGVSLKVGATTLAAVGDSVALGTIDAAGNGLHVHPEWRLLLPNGVTGAYHVSFRLTTTSAAYAQSPVYAATITNVPPTTTTVATSTSTTATSTSTTSTTTTSTSSSSTATSTSTTATSTSTTSTTTTSTSTTSTTTTSTSSSSTTSSSLLLPTTTTLPSFSSDLLGGTTLTLAVKASNPAKSKLKVIAKDASATLGDPVADAPTATGGSLRIRSTAGDFDLTYELPATHWKLVGKSTIKGYKYTDRLGPVTSVVITAGKLVKAVAKGPGLTFGLGTDPEPVDVVLTIGAHRYCLRFGGTPKWKPGTTFTAKDAPPPTTCLP